MKGAVMSRFGFTGVGGRKTRTALTIVELCVAVTVVTLLAALLLPALGGALGVSRRSACASNLHQLGHALAGHLETHGAFPTANLPEPALWPLLPRIEQASLRNALISRNPPEQLPEVPVLVCPSDPVVWEQSSAGDVSYYFSDGSSLRIAGHFDGFRKSTSHDTAPSEIVDGLSNTAAMSERMVRKLSYHHPLSAEDLERETGRYLWYTPRRYARPGEEFAAAQMCRDERVSPVPAVFGANANAYRPNTGYDHMLTPNSPACYNGAIGQFDAQFILLPPSSLHSGGVNVLMADGSVRFTADAVDSSAWAALGTRNGAE
jgi:prepilin-type processing-associated H-X9-DG protein